ncbi:MAG: HAD family phosphatase [Actinomycetota bacterium]
MSERPSTTPIEAVLFDMGGVLVELGPFDEALGLDDLSSEEFWAMWLASPAVRDLEAGRCSVERFADELVIEFGLGHTQGELIEHFTNIPLGLFPGAVDLVASVPAQVMTGVLSNTNAVHWEGQQDADVIQRLCQRQYLSYELGMTKPERGIFDHAAADLGVSPDRILFLDDSPANVDGARAAGLQAEVARGPVAGAKILESYGVTRR